MKKNFWLLLSAAMAMFSVTSCTQDETAADGGMETEVTATIEAPAYDDPQIAIEVPSTRTFLVEGNEYENGVGTWWSTKETIGVYSSSAKNVKFTSTNSKSAQSVSFSGWLFGSPKYAYYPYDSSNSNSQYSAVKMTMPVSRSFNSTTKGLSSDFYAGKLAEKGWFSSTFTFERLVALWKISVDATGTALENAKLQKISVKVNNNRQISGDFTVDLASKEVSMGGFSTGDDGIEILYTTNPVMYANSSYNAYATVMPNVEAGDELVFTITSSAGTATFTTTAAVSQEANGFYVFPIVLAEMGDVDVDEDETGDSEMPTSDYKITEMAFTVANNPGKILPRTFTHDASFNVKVTNITEVKCTIDQENHKITLCVPYLFDYKLIPTITTSSSDALLAYGQGLITSGETVVDFAAYKQIAVGNENGATMYDVEITNTGLPIVVVNQMSGTVSSESGDYQKASAAWYAATGTKWQPKNSDWSMEDGDNFMVYNADGTSALKDKNGMIVKEPVKASTRLRGNVTQQMPKKPFAVKLDSKSAVLDMPAHKRWVLLANWKDRTMMRNSVAFAMAKTFKNIFPKDGMEWNPSGEFVELVYNGVHVGTYYLCEQIKIDGNRLDINDPYDAKDNPAAPADCGILMESDDGYDETWQFTTACYVPFLFKDDGNDDMLSYASTFVRGIEDNLYKNTTAGYNAAFEKMDLTSFVDFWLIQEVMMNSETKHPKSCYSYINNGKMYAGPLWDFDWNTLPVSSSYSEESYTYTTSMIESALPSSGWFGSKTYYCFHTKSGYPSEPIEDDDKSYLWYPMLVKSADFKALAAERWNAVKSYLKADVGIHIDKMYQQLMVSESYNNKMWPVDTKKTSNTLRGKYGIGNGYGQYGGYCGDEGMSFKASLDQLKTTINSRIDGMSYISNQNWPNVTYGSK